MLNQYFWQTIQQEGERLGISLDKKRALIREYLQSKIIYYLYQKKDSHRLSFIGGTSLRMLRNLDRFSEDLDFDNLGLRFDEIKRMFEKVSADFKKEDIKTEFGLKKTNDSGIGAFKFPLLLFELGISSHRDEKLNIRINYTSPKTKPSVETLPLSRFGLVQAVVTNTPEVLLSQKLKAIIGRKDLQPRDFYDVVWFLSQNIEPDFIILKEVNIGQKEELAEKMIKVYQKNVVPRMKSFKARLRPFLIDEKRISYLDMFGKVVGNKWGRQTTGKNN